MNLEEITIQKTRADLEKIKKIKAWRKRIKLLSGRKNDPVSEQEFCKRHDISHAHFNRIKNLKEKSLPSESWIQSIERALEAEGV